MRYFARVLALGLPLAVVLACGSGPSQASLEDRVFVSTRVTEDGAPRELVEGTRLRLEFYEGSRVTASAGCNLLDGRYEILAGTFVLGDASMTLIGCDPALHEQDEWYFGFLQSNPTIVVEGDSLVLEEGDTRLEYLDQEVATPDLPLLGTTWTVDTIIEGDAAIGADWPDPATLVLRSNGTVDVYTGCNSGSGTYRVVNDAITFADVAVTERACLDELTQQLEAAVLGVVSGPQPVTWEITVDRLSLRGEDVGLVLVGS